MKAEDLKTKSGDELSAQLLDLKKEQFNLRFQLSQGQLQNTARIRAVRRDIARVSTFLNAKNDGAEKAPKAKAKADKPAAKKKTAGKKSAA